MKEMKEDNFIEFIKKNKIVMLCIAIALILLVTGVFKVLLNIAIVVFVIIGAMYIGYKIQGDEEYIKKFFRAKKNK